MRGPVTVDAVDAGRARIGILVKRVTDGALRETQV
jgi:hypothetical protein